MFKLSSLPRNLTAALRDLESPKETVRQSALQDLGRLATDEDSPREALEAMAHALQNDAAPEVRAAAALALADAEAVDQLPALIAAADDVHTRVRQMVLVALGEIARPTDEAALEVIRAGIEDSTPAIRFQSLVALHRVVGSPAVPQAMDLTRDPDDSVRYVALRIIEESWEETQEALDMPTGVRVRALLRDDAAPVRLAAAILLARSGDRSGVDEIAAAVGARSGSFQLEDELAAVELAGQLGLDKAQRALQRRAFGLFGSSNDAAAFQARVALAQLGNERAVETILRGLSAWTRDARTIAVAAAGRARLRQARPLIAAMRGDARSADPHAVEEALALIDKNDAATTSESDSAL